MFDKIKKILDLEQEDKDESLTIEDQVRMIHEELYRSYYVMHWLSMVRQSILLMDKSTHEYPCEDYKYMILSVAHVIGELFLSYELENERVRESLEDVIVKMMQLDNGNENHRLAVLGAIAFLKEINLLTIDNMINLYKDNTSNTIH